LTNAQTRKAANTIPKSHQRKLLEAVLGRMLHITWRPAQEHMSSKIQPELTLVSDVRLLILEGLLVRNFNN
jgi:hypothetical protein